MNNLEQSNNTNNSSLVTMQTKAENLPVYQQAAELQGVNLDVIAKEGEIFGKNIKVTKGYVAITISREYTIGGLQDFWDTTKLIKAELPNVRIS